MAEKPPTSNDDDVERQNSVVSAVAAAAAGLANEDDAAVLGAYTTPHQSLLSTLLQTQSLEDIEEEPQDPEKPQNSPKLTTTVSKTRLQARAPPQLRHHRGLRHRLFHHGPPAFHCVDACVLAARWACWVGLGAFLRSSSVDTYIPIHACVCGMRERDKERENSDFE